MLPTNYDDDDIRLLEKLINELLGVEEKLGAEAVKKESKYSKVVTQYIGSVEELRFYQNRLKLVERKITRNALTRETIDLSMRDVDGVANYDRMRNGKPPVVKQYAVEGLELHHMKQEYKGTFAELTPEEHAHPGTGVVLHPKNKRGEESWRADLERSHAFDKERANYWIKRGEMITSGHK